EPSLLRSCLFLPLRTPSASVLYPLSLHDALPIYPWACFRARRGIHSQTGLIPVKFESLPQGVRLAVEAAQEKKAAGITVLDLTADRKSTRLNSSHVSISYAVFCLKIKTRHNLSAR